MEEFMKLVAQYQCNTNVDVSSSESDCDSDITSGISEQTKLNKATKDADVESGKRKNSGTTVRLPTRRPDPNVYNRNALLARENRRKKKAHMEAVEKELHETRNTNRSLLKALKKQFKLTQKLEKECQHLKNMLGNYKSTTTNFATSLNANTNCVSPDNRAVSPDGSLISTYSSSSYEQPMDTNSLTGLLNVDNGSVAEQQFINDAQSGSWNDFIDDLLTDYQPTPAYENGNLNRFLDESSFDLPEGQLPLKPLGIVDEHSYFNKFAEVGSSPIPDCDWSASRTPPTQLLQDDDFLDFTVGERIASL